MQNFFRQIDLQYNSLVKQVQKIVGGKFGNFHTVSRRKIFREINSLVLELISRIIFQ